MKEIIIQKDDSGQRLDKFLQKYFKQASKSFLYKMLRKKNIKLNNKKAEGKEMLQMGDQVSIYFSDETFEKFRGVQQKKIFYPTTKLSILYEDNNVVILNKPAGMLSQKAKNYDVTLVEYFLGYLQKSGKWSPGSSFTPGVCNRLDRNTSGIVIAGKSLAGLQKMSELLKERRIDKYYKTIVQGVMRESSVIRGYLEKDEKTNKVSIYEQEGEGRSYIETGYEPLMDNGEYTLLRVKLITGKTHQIRSHLSSIGHPILGDVKYGGKKIQDGKGFFLHAESVFFPELDQPFACLSGQIVQAPLPERFERMVYHLFGKRG